MFKNFYIDSTKKGIEALAISYLVTFCFYFFTIFIYYAKERLQTKKNFAIAPFNYSCFPSLQIPHSSLPFLSKDNTYSTSSQTISMLSIHFYFPSYLGHTLSILQRLSSFPILSPTLHSQATTITSSSNSSP